MGLFGFGKPNVDKLKAKRDVDGLIKAMSYGRLQDYTVRCAAIEAIRECDRSPKAVDAIVGALNDQSDNVKASAIEALGAISGDRAIDKLVPFLGNGSDYLRSTTVDALANIGGPGVVDGLVLALKDPVKYIRYAAVEALGRIGDPRAVDGLVLALKDPEPYHRQITADALGKIGGSAAANGLASLLQDKEWMVRERAIKALGEVGGPETVDGLVLALEDPEDNIRRAAVEALEKIGDPRAADALKEYKAAEDSARVARAAAAEAQKKAHYAAYNRAKRIIGRITLCDPKSMGSPGAGGPAFQAAIQAWNGQNYAGAENGLKLAMEQGLDTLRTGYAYAMIGEIKLISGDLDGAILNFEKVFENKMVLIERVDKASKFLGVIYGEMGRYEEAQAYGTIADNTSAQVGYSLSPDVIDKTRALVKARAK